MFDHLPLTYLHYGHCGLTKLTSIVSKLEKTTGVHGSAKTCPGICCVCRVCVVASALAWYFDMYMCYVFWKQLSVWFVASIDYCCVILNFRMLLYCTIFRKWTKLQN